jgi:hypothetical protein
MRQSATLLRLPNGLAARYVLKRRERDPFYLVSFLGPDGRRREKSTGHSAQRLARRAAHDLISQTFEVSPSPRSSRLRWSWLHAREALVENMKLNGASSVTVEQYERTARFLESVFVDYQGPADLRQQDALAFIEARRGAGRSARTIKNEVAMLGTIFRRHWIPAGAAVHNPFSKGDELLRTSFVSGV